MSHRELRVTGKARRVQDWDGSAGSLVLRERQVHRQAVVLGGRMGSYAVLGRNLLSGQAHGAADVLMCLWVVRRLSVFLVVRRV